MSHWNYRLMRSETKHEDGEVETVLEVVECYYDEAGFPNGYCEATVMGETVEEVLAVLTRMMSGCAKEVLVAADFQRKEKAS